MAPDDMLRPTLARDVVRFQGEAIAVVVAESRGAAVDAAELVDVDIEPLEIVVDPERALADDAPQLFPDKGSNLVFSGGSADEGALEGADVVVRSRYVNQRLAAVRWSPPLPSPRPTRRRAACASGLRCRRRTPPATSTPARSASRRTPSE
jgi:CO/xanthine dehydrogenase Mo-binding subunit